MSVTLSPIGGVAGQFFDNNGQPLSGGKIYTYAAGTTTPQACYTSAAGSTPHSNPIVLDSAGRVPGGEIWLTDSLLYKFVIETSTAILIGTYDNISGINSNFVNYTVQEEVQTATAGQTVFTLTTINYAPGTNSLSVYIDGVNQYVGTSYLETDSTTVTFTSGLHVGAEVKFTTAVQSTTGAVNASIVTYDPPFTGAVATNVENKLAQYVSVKDFGAVGDGTTDDTAAIQAAVDSGAGAIYLPSSTYIIDGRVALPSDIRVYGDGASSILKKTSTATQRNTFYFTSSAVVNVEVDHIQFLSDRTAINADTAAIDGSISTTDFDNIYIHDNLFSYPVDGTGCILFAAKPTTTCNNIRITENTFDTVQYFAVATNNNNSDAVVRNSNVHVTGNVFKSCAGFCTTIAGGTSNVVVANNTFYGANGYGVEFAGPVIGGVIDGNVFSGSFSEIIALSAGASYAQNDNIVISNNTTQGAVTANWTLQGCASLTMQGNRFNTSGQLVFNGTTLGITAFVSGNWFQSAIAVINGAVVSQFNNYIGTVAPVNTAPAQYTVDLTGGDTTSTAVITFASFTSWRPVGAWVRLTQVADGGAGGAYAESVIAARVLNGTSAVQISKTDTVTSGSLTLSVAYGTNTMTVTATSTTADVRQIWMIQPFGQGVEDTLVTVSA